MRGIANLVLVALLLIACGGAGGLPGGPPAAQQPRAPAGTGSAGGICYLVTDAEVASVTGRPALLGGSGFELGGTRFCNWTLYLDPVESVGLTLTRAENFEQGRFGSEETVSGVGNDAYWEPTIGMLSVLTGTYMLTVLVSTDRIDDKAAAISIARAALTRLS